MYSVKNVKTKKTLMHFLEQRHFVLHDSSESLTNETTALYSINDSGDLLEVIITDKVDPQTVNKHLKHISNVTPIKYQLLIKKDFSSWFFQRSKPRKLSRYDHQYRLTYLKDSHISKPLQETIETKINDLRYETRPYELFLALFDNESVVNDFYETYMDAKELLVHAITADTTKELLAQILLDRVIFIYFLQSKEILQKNFLSSLYYAMSEGENYYAEYLKPLFFEIFCEERATRSPCINVKLSHIPYLHANLFTRIEGIEIINGQVVTIHVPNKVWADIFHLFDGYTWSIESGESNAITPMILGYIYEKSVAKKQTGSYYTPNNITSFIATTLIERYCLDSLNKKYKADYTNLDQVFNLPSSTRIEYVITLYFDILKPIRVCDPALGSGAFLIAAEYVLFELYHTCVIILRNESCFNTELENILHCSSVEYYLKKEIITKNLYGVDIHTPCIEITKLRLWLSLIADIPTSSTLEPLPNIDYNLVSGNSLIGYIDMPDIKNSLHNLVSSEFQHIDTSKGENKTIQNLYFLFEVLSQKKREYLRADSGKTSELREFIDSNLAFLRKTLTRLYWKEYNPMQTETINFSDSNIKGKEKKYLQRLKQINETCTISYFKINLKDNNTLNYDRIKNIHGIRSYKDRKTNIVKSIFPTRSFDYTSFTQTKNALITLLQDILTNWDHVETIEIKRTMLLEELTATKPFHWCLEFIDIFTHNQGFDIVIGNPPYGNLLSNYEKSIIEHAYSDPYVNEIASIFTDRTIAIQAKGGSFGYIITYAITFHKKFSKSRFLLSHSYTDCYISTYDRDKCNIFSEMRQSVSIVFCYTKNSSCTSTCSFFTSQMYRDIPPSLSTINYSFANTLLLSDKGLASNFDLPHRLPKIGDTKPILLKLLLHKNSLSTILTHNGNYIWYRTSGNYWYNAFFTQPYQSSEINRLYLVEAYQDFVLCLINSQLFYIWLRIYGDGRHLNKDILASTPIPSLPVLRENKKVFKTLSMQLMERLFAVFDTERNRFSTSEIKKELDIVDITLGKLYGLSIEEIKYVLDYERIIHGGCKLTDKEIETIYYKYYTKS